MVVLGIETSCDETAVAVVNEQKRILSNCVLSQNYESYGGVVPEIAARAHLDHLDHLICQALEQAKVSLDDITAIAVTAGPGLIGGVLVGVMTAKAIAMAKNIPFLAVNHLQGHALTVRLTHEVPFPYLLLLVSGGHCQFLEVKGVDNYHLLGTTIDDAAGEAFDKVARLLGHDYPGGPAVEKLAIQGDPKRFMLPRPLKGRKGCDFSFAGLKTAVRAVIQKQSSLSDQDKADIAASFQQAIADCLCDRALNAIGMTSSPIRYFVVAGGVAANQFLRHQLEQVAQARGLMFITPPMFLCTDNAAMIAWTGIEMLRLGRIQGLDFTPRPRWPLVEGS